MNADDLGLSAGVNRGILEAHEHGIVTSASLMVDRPAAEEAAELVRDATRLSIGLHAVLGGGDGVLIVPPEADLLRQLTRFVKLVGRPPTHLDSHHHVHRAPRLTPAFLAFAARHELPLRNHSAAHYCGSFYGRPDGAGHPGRIGVANLLAILEQLDDGVTEIGCHPGYPDDLDSSYTAEREQELRTLTDSRVRARIEELAIELIGFHEVR